MHTSLGHLRTFTFAFALLAPVLVSGAAAGTAALGQKPRKATAQHRKYKKGVALASAAVQTQTPKTPYEQIDAHYRKRNERESAEQGLELARLLYVKSRTSSTLGAQTAAQKDAQAAWRVGMGCYLLGFKFTPAADSAENKALKTALYKEGMEAAQAGAEADPKCAPCHFWAGVNMALYGETVGAFKMFSIIDQVRRHAEASSEIDPTYASGGAYRLLGQIEEGLPGILGGSNSQAQKWFEKAVQTVPNDPMNYSHLVRILLKRGREEQALETARKALELPAPASDQFESLLAIEDLKRVVADLGSPDAKKR